MVRRHLLRSLLDIATGGAARPAVQNQLPSRPNCVGAPPPRHHEGVVTLERTTPDGSATFSGDLETARYHLPRYLLRMPLLLPTPLLGSRRQWAGQQGSQRTGWLPP
jgi:hypothetical protein